MAIFRSSLLILSIVFSPLRSTLAASASDRRINHGLVGYGIVMFDPPCAYACKDVVSPSPLNCTPHEDHGGHGGHHHIVTPPECFANDDAFLQTMAYCIDSNCEADVPLWKLEYFWWRDLVGRSDNLPKPKDTLQETLGKITTVPAITMTSGDPLNQTSLVPQDAWYSNHVTLTEFAKTERWHARSGLIVLLTIFLAPIALSWLQFAPLPNHIISKANAILVQPAMFGKRHSQPMPFNIGIAPTRGQALFIAFVISINVIFTSVGIHFGHPNAWYPDNADDGIRGSVSNRMGVLAFVNLILVFLFSGRNNILLWVTDWSHSTYLLLHRWIAYVAIVQACLHSVLWLDNYVAKGTHSSESKLPYWYWGIIATLAVSLMLPLSILPVRQKVYEIFLATHIVLAALTIIGCYLHIWFIFKNMWGYETWLYPSMALWLFDRLVRVLRLTRNGIKRAYIEVIDDDYTMVTVPGVTDDGYAYLYFPTLTWRFWENHPFSIASIILPGSTRNNSESSVAVIEKSAITSTAEHDDVERNPVANFSGSKPTLGVTFFIRNQSGLTSLLRTRQSLPVLVESPYGHHADLSSFPTFICIAGGVGITAVLPALRKHVGYAKLYWGVRSDGIVKAMEPHLMGIDKTLSIGKRFVMSEVLAREIEADKSDVAVMVSGPPGMADDVRAIVSEYGRRSGKRRVELIEESFTW